MNYVINKETENHNYKSFLFLYRMIFNNLKNDDRRKHLECIKIENEKAIVTDGKELRFCVTGHEDGFYKIGKCYNTLLIAKIDDVDYPDTDLVLGCKKKLYDGGSFHDVDEVTKTILYNIPEGHFVSTKMIEKNMMSMKECDVNIYEVNNMPMVKLSNDYLTSYMMTKRI